MSLQEPERRRALLADVLLPGAMAGLAGAVVMAVVAMILAAIVGDSPLHPALLVSTLFLRAENPPAWAALLGVVVHLGIGGALGTTFALLIPRHGTQAAGLLLGALFGLALQVVMPQLVLPYLSVPLARAAQSPALLLLHLAFGVTLGTMVPARRLFSRLAPWS